MTSFQRIVCPTDFSPTASRAVDLAAGLASTFGAELVLLHVVPRLYYPTRGLALEAIAHIEQQLEARAKELLGEQSLPGNTASVQREVRHGDPYEQILACAHDRKADLVVLGTHGYTGLKHALLGSTAERVVRLAECPVLTVHGRA